MEALPPDPGPPLSGELLEERPDEVIKASHLFLCFQKTLAFAFGTQPLGAREDSQPPSHVVGVCPSQASPPQSLRTWRAFLGVDGGFNLVCGCLGLGVCFFGAPEA